METLLNIFRVIHVINAILMAWPFYALITVNQRARLGPPLGDRVDTYMENIVKNRTIPCFVFQATALVSGILIVWLRGLGPDALIANPLLGIKFLLLLSVGGLLGYVHLRLQPKIDALFARSGGMTADTAARIGALRLRRKRIASVCMFTVLAAAVLGVQAWAAFHPALTILLLAAVGLFTYRAYKSVAPYGWF